jgi:ribonuclease HI
MKYNKLKIYTDGGARGNPGPAGIGVVIFDENDQKIDSDYKFIGEATNNQAEYKALILAFEMIEKYKVDELAFFLDSELVVKQVKGEYRVKNKDLAPLFVKIHNQIIKHKKTSFTHIRRELNKEADKLANMAMDKGA